MNWLKQHLNWAWVIMLAATFVLMILIMLPASDTGSSPLEGIAIIGWVIGLFLSSFWVLSQKRRSPWWVLLAGYGSVLWLSNKRTEPQSISTSAGQTIPAKTLSDDKLSMGEQYCVKCGTKLKTEDRFCAICGMKKPNLALGTPEA